MDFKIKIGCGIDIDKDTAELALKIVNIYCNNNEVTVKEKTKLTDDDGVELYFSKLPIVKKH